MAGVRCCALAAAVATVVGFGVAPAMGAVRPASPPTSSSPGASTPRAKGPHVLPFTPPAARKAAAVAPQRAATTSAATTGPHLSYYGGKVLSNVKVVQVIYGAGTYLPQTTAGTSPSVSSFFAGTTNSPYFDWLSEYNTTIKAVGGQTGTNQTIGRGTFAGRYAITPSSANNGSTIQDSNIQAELRAQVAAGHLPAPDANTLYSIFFRNGQSVCLGSTCSLVSGGFCAYHNTIPAGGGLPELYYTVDPDLSGVAGCGGGTAFQNTTSVASHEMIESVTDAEVGLATSYAPPLGWYDGTNGEIGDICVGQAATITGGDGVVYTVQKEWSNVANSCIVTRTVTNDFSLAASPSSVSVVQGAKATSTIASSVTSGAAQSIALSATGLPSGASASFSPTSVTAGSSATLTIATASSTPAGTYGITVTGAGTSVTHSFTVTLTVASATSGTPSGIINGGFETGNLKGWTPGGASASVVNSGCYAGSYCARLGSTVATNGDSTIAQTFTAPAGTSRLTFAYKMKCVANSGTDWVYAILRDPSAGTTTFALPTAYCTIGGQWLVTITITAGHTYTLTFDNHNDNNPANPTFSIFDSVAVA